MTLASPAFTNDTLTCEYTFYDVDGHAEGPTSIDWTVLRSSGTTATFSGPQLGSSFFDKDDVVSCAVTPHDGIDAGLTVDATVIIANSPPSLGSTGYVSITNMAGGLPDATVERPLLCTYGTFQDADSADTDQSLIAWRVNNGPVSGYGDTFYPSIHGPLSVGDLVTCEVTPFDGTTTGVVRQDVVTIGYAAPTVSHVTASPDDPTVRSTLDCTFAFEDPDNDPSLSTYRWRNGNGLTIGIDSQPLRNTSGTNDTFLKGDTLRCRATAVDAHDVGNTASSPWVTVVNSPPEMTRVEYPGPDGRLSGRWRANGR